MIEFYDLYNKTTKISNWMISSNLKSYDPYDDLTSTTLYKIINLFHSNRVNERFKKIQSLSRIGIEKTKSSITSALFADTCAVLYDIDENPKWLYHLNNELNWLIKNKTKFGYSWGLPFDWNMGNNEILAIKGTPFSTLSLYMVDAFIKGYNITKNEHYKISIENSNTLFTKDLKQRNINENTTSLSYSPIDNFFVINVNAYAAATLHTISEFNPDYNFSTFIQHLINYVVKQQNQDGSWDYFGEEQNRPGYIDSLHQIYILQNLVRCSKSYSLERSIKSGIKYLEDAFITQDNLISKFPYDFTHGFELIDIAEIIHLYILMNNFERSNVFLESMITHFIKDKPPYFKSKIHYNETTLPFFRWGAIQSIHSMGESLYHV